MIAVYAALLTGLILTVAGVFYSGIAIGEGRLRRELRQAELADAMARVQIRPALPRAGAFPTTPNVIYSDWQAGIDAAEREIRQLTQRAAEVIPLRYR